MPLGDEPKGLFYVIFVHFCRINWKKEEKESIQQQVPLQLPCYDLVTIMSFTVDQRDHRRNGYLSN